MNCLFSQIILAARGQEDDKRGWMQLLILIIVGVVYGVATLARAKANKVNLEEEGPAAASPKGKPRYKPVEQWSAPGRSRSADTRAEEGGLQVSIQHQPRLPVQPAKRPVIRKKPPLLVPERIGLPAGPALGRVMPDLSMPKLGRIKKLETKLRPLETKLRPIDDRKQPEPAEKPAVTPLLGYEEPDPLRAAILYYEILGKPLALRDRSQEHF